MYPDLGNNVRTQRALSPAARTASANGAANDLAGYEILSYLIATGAVTTLNGTDKFTFKVQTSPDDVTYTDIDTTDDYIASRDEAGVAWDRVLNAAGHADKSFTISVRTRTPRYARVVATAAGAPSVIFGVTAVKSNARHNPA